MQFNGHAIEARVYAEDPETFIPSPGTITALAFPKEDAKIRIDHALKENMSVPPYYDPMLAKVIAWGNGPRQCLDSSPQRHCPNFR